MKPDLSAGNQNNNNNNNNTLNNTQTQQLDSEQKPIHFISRHECNELAQNVDDKLTELGDALISLQSNIATHQQDFTTLNQESNLINNHTHDELNSCSNVAALMHTALVWTQEQSDHIDHLLRQTDIH